MITHITVEDAAKLISRIAGTNETHALTYIREAADREGRCVIAPSDCLMGYEAVEDCTETQESARAHSKNPCDFCQRGKGRGLSYYFECGDCGKNGIFDRFKPKEANMNKPRICGVLGVEVDERFQVEKYSSADFHFNRDGELYVEGTNDPEYCSAIIQAINHPDRIIRKPRFTQQDIEDAKILLRCFNKPQGIIKRHDGEMAKPYNCLTFDNIYINQEMFPGIKKGKEYSLNEILSLAPPIKKSYGDYTLKEANEICAQQENCSENCPLWKEKFGSCEMVDSIPENWEFQEEN